MIEEIKHGRLARLPNFMGAVIDQKAFDEDQRLHRRRAQYATIVAGGKVDAATGYFIAPTLVETQDPGYRLLCEEIFGPVVTVHLYNDGFWLR